MPTTPTTPRQYPDPFVVPPLRLPHKQSLIVLHGRGSNGRQFGSEFLEQRPLRAAEETGLTFREHFPHATFIFPTAAPRRARSYGRSIINQWFDCWDLAEPNERTHWMVEGLRESAAFVQDLIRQEILKVGSENVVVGGLSQGCTLVLASLLLGSISDSHNGVADSIPAGMFGMCGWLPFGSQIEETIFVADDISHDEDDPFERSENEGTEETTLQRSRALIRSELNLTMANRVDDRMPPIFLGHGVLDDRVAVDLGRQAAKCFEKIGAEVRWREYDTLGHWYSDEMLLDILQFLQEKTDWSSESTNQSSF